MHSYPYYPTTCYNTFSSFLSGIQVRYKNQPAITQYDQDGVPYTVTYQQIYQTAHEFGEALLQKGLQGKHIAIAGENSLEWLISFFTVTAIGSVAVLIDIDQDTDTIRKMISSADCDFLIMSDSVKKLFSKDGPISKMESVSICSDDKKAPNSFQSVCAQGAQLIAQQRKAFLNLKTNGNDLAVIAFTSGTTNASKAVMLSQKGILINAGQSMAMVKFTEKVFTFLPFFHTYGITCCVLNALIAGCHLCINGNLKTFQRDLGLFRPGTLLAVPLVMEIINKNLSQALSDAGLPENPPEKQLLWFHRKEESVPPEWKAIKQKCLGDLSLLICGGACLAPDVVERMHKFGIVCLEGYGITECSPLISVNRNKDYCFGSVGKILPCFQLKLQEDEILVRGDSVMIGYYKDKELTDSVLIDGWFHTGDLGVLDKNGFLHITGRKKNLIVLKNGKKVSPEEIETRVSQLPLVKEVIAYGASIGEVKDNARLAVMIYPDPDKTQGMNSYEVLNLLQKQIDELNVEYPSYKQIQLVNLRETPFEKTSAQKIKRQI
ncbi:MAG: AMP-binding protein [Clostridiales bacterium]|jgi:long-chain acyl-CoA synthetase|nr:AMP-binding protein [Clostridiales bacterium]MCI2161997.1 AMP-binding protein [Oscillospiraceae bacterium]MCI1961320.1 AMP-binding protein [Clostridiales bacterium]MCI2021761.1 AMP-binding protein [Clostridiales bacterium]MCI2026548.1 AMP-binding protein [Clostridiales bacterium]